VVTVIVAQLVTQWGIGSFGGACTGQPSLNGYPIQPRRGIQHRRLNLGQLKIVYYSH